MAHPAVYVLSKCKVATPPQSLARDPISDLHRVCGPAPTSSIAEILRLEELCAQDLIVRGKPAFRPHFQVLIWGSRYRIRNRPASHFPLRVTGVRASVSRYSGAGV